MSVRDTFGQISLWKCKAFACQRQRRSITILDGEKKETISYQLGLTSRLCVAYDTVLETLGMATVYIRDNSNWSEGGRLEVTQYVNQSMGFSCEIWRRCFVSDQRSQAAPNFLLSQPVAAD